MSREIFEDFIAEISDQYTYDSYDLLRNNCNNFTQTASNFLTGNSIPAWISGLPQDVLSTPFGRMIEPMITQWTTRMKQQSMMAQGMDPSNFPATQAAFTQQFFPTAPAVQAPPTPALSAPSTRTVDQRASVSISATSSNVASAHMLRRPLFADQRPSSFTTILKQINLGSRTQEVTDALQSFFETPGASLAPIILDALVEHLDSCDLSAGFAPLFILRLLVLNSPTNKAFSADPRAVPVLQRFLSNEQVPTQPKAMALLVATNLFSDKVGETLMLESPHTLEWLGSELSSSVDQRRTPAAGLLYNFALALSVHPKESIGLHEDKFWQSVTLIAEVLETASKNAPNPSSLTTTEEEFFWRVCSALYYFIESDNNAKTIASQLDLVPTINAIKSRASGAKLISLLSDLVKLL
jgi:hypothetical protein